MCHSVISSTTLSVIREMVSLDDLGAVDLGEVRGDLPGRQPAGGQRQHDLRRCHPTGVAACARSPARSSRPGPAAPRSGPARPRSAPSSTGCRSGSSRRCGRPGRACHSPGARDISASSAVSSTVFVNPVSRPPGPTRSTPSARPAPPAAGRAAADRSAPAWARSSRSLLVLPAKQARRVRTSYTVCRTVPLAGHAGTGRRGSIRAVGQRHMVLRRRHHPAGWRAPPDATSWLHDEARRSANAS